MVYPIFCVILFWPFWGYSSFRHLLYPNALLQQQLYCDPRTLLES
jgi:hypothetical protein